MSRVISLVLLTSHEEDDQAIAWSLNDWLSATDGRWGLTEMQGSGIRIGHCIYAADLVGFDRDMAAFIDVFIAADWTQPDLANLIVQPDEGPAKLVRPLDVWPKPPDPAA